MQKNKSIVLMAFVMALFLFYTVATVYATNGISVSSGVISPGGTTTITLTVEKGATGTMKVTAPDNTTVWVSVVGISIVGSGSQSWIFPTDFPAGANATNPGSYKVEADIVGSIYYTTFKVEFFVAPDLPFGTLMAVVACFGAVIGYKKLKQ